MSVWRDENRSSEGIDLVDVKAILQRAEYLLKDINFLLKAGLLIVLSCNIF